MTHPSTKAERERRRAFKLCRECAATAVEGSTFCETHREANREASKRAHFKLKLQALDAYGGCRCVCCGETIVEFLTLDHINGDGAAHRREAFGLTRSPGGANFYNWLKRNGFPPGLRVLCYNCNCARRTDGTCPHERVALENGA